MGIKIVKSRQTYQVKTITDYPEYDGSKPETAYTKDLSILKIRRAFVFDDNYSPICLPSTRDDAYENKEGIVLGWGLFKREKFPDRLMIVNVSTESNSECGNANWFNINPKIHICAGRATKYDACSGDSGGPLVIKENNK